MAEIASGKDALPLAIMYKLRKLQLGLKTDFECTLATCHSKVSLNCWSETSDLNCCLLLKSDVPGKLTFLGRDSLSMNGDC